MGAGQNLPNDKVLCSQIECPHRANFMGAPAPIAPMVPIYTYVIQFDSSIYKNEKQCRVIYNTNLHSKNTLCRQSLTFALPCWGCACTMSMQIYSYRFTAMAMFLLLGVEVYVHMYIYTGNIVQLWKRLYTSPSPIYTTPFFHFFLNFSCKPFPLPVLHYNVLSLVASKVNGYQYIILFNYVTLQLLMLANNLTVQQLIHILHLYTLFFKNCTHDVGLCRQFRKKLQNMRNKILN